MRIILIVNRQMGCDTEHFRHTSPEERPLGQPRRKPLRRQCESRRLEQPNDDDGGPHAAHAGDVISPSRFDRFRY
ncbi:hypothetical protein [Nocardia sp. NPDC050412]|uniref:hypothetical protein n=1 Tax=Nocardia sp. NPDC050412 TaxID=3364320 RepID=UPI0037980D9F